MWHYGLVLGDREETCLFMRCLFYCSIWRWRRYHFALHHCSFLCCLRQGGFQQQLWFWVRDGTSRSQAGRIQGRQTHTSSCRNHAARCYQTVAKCYRALPGISARQGIVKKYVKVTATLIIMSPLKINHIVLRVCSRKLLRWSCSSW